MQNRSKTLGRRFIEGHDDTGMRCADYLTPVECGLQIDRSDEDCILRRLLGGQPRG